MPVSKQRQSALAKKFASVVDAPKYITTATSCTCPDHKYRNRVCKHMRELIEPKEHIVSEEDMKRIRNMEAFF